MRTFLLALALALPLTAQDKPAAITAEEALKKIDEKVTVEMEVKSVGKGKGDIYFLNSKESYRDKENFTIYINKDGAAKFKEAKIEDPGTHFKGKKIRVTGKVVKFNDKIEIIVDKADMIETVEEKKDK